LPLKQGIFSDIIEGVVDEIRLVCAPSIYAVFARILERMIRDTVPIGANYYEATARRDGYPELRAELNVDICVIGGGIAGCSTALHLATKGYRVALIEAQQIGAGASGRSGGQLIPGYSCGQPVLQRQLGNDAARVLWDISVEAVQLAAQLIADHQIQCELKSGHLDAAIKPGHRDELLRHQHQLQRDYDYRSLRWVEGSQLQALIQSDRYSAGLYDSAAASMHPLNYTLGLARAATQCGALIHEHSPVAHVEQTAESVRVATSSAAVTAKYAVLCANVGNVPLSSHSTSILPVTTYMIATQPLDQFRDPTHPIMNPDVAVSDCNFIVDYFRVSQSRLLFGGGVSYSGHPNPLSIQYLRKRMHAVFPQLEGAQIDYAWHGLLDISRNRAPNFGRIDSNIYYLQGFSGHGLALATMAGKLVAESIAVQSERFDLFSRIEHRPFPGGPLRTPLLMLAMLWYRIRDLM